MSLTGAPIGAEVRITNADGVSHSPALLPTDDGYALAWLDGRDDISVMDPVEPFFVRLATDGAPLATERLVSAPPATGHGLSMAGGGDGYAIAWDAADRVLFARVDPDGALRSAPVDLGSGWRTTIVETASGYAAAWVSFDAAHVAHLDADGARILPDTIVEARHGRPSGVDLAWTGSFEVIALVDWDEDGSQEHVYVTAIGADGSMTGAPVVASLPREFMPVSPRLCFGGGRGAVVWVDGRDEPGNYDVYFRRLELCE